MSNDVKQFDSWFNPHAGPAAVVIRETLMSVEGADGVIFPPTFASGDGFKGGYNIDEFTKDDKTTNVCLIDSVGSQANRIEPIFADEPYAALVPQIVVVAGDHRVSIFEAGHRAGDALLRCSELAEELQSAFYAVQKGNAEPMAKIAPTSLVFGVWDSRDTQAKLPRLVSSTVRAFDVRKLSRSAQFNPAVDYSQLEVFTEAEKQKAEGNTKSPQAQRGFVHVPATGSHGGVIADGGVRRDVTLSLAALQLLKAGDDKDQTLALRRYILGLSLVALTANTSAYLRQGCNLVCNPDQPRTFDTVHRDGKREPADLTHDQALAFAQAAAEAFGVGEDREVEFDKKRAKQDVKQK